MEDEGNVEGEGRGWSGEGRKERGQLEREAVESQLGLYVRLHLLTTVSIVINCNRHGKLELLFLFFVRPALLPLP